MIKKAALKDLFLFHRYIVPIHDISRHNASCILHVCLKLLVLLHHLLLFLEAAFQFVQNCEIRLLGQD